MEIPTKEDFERFENKLISMLTQIMDKIDERNEKTSLSMILNVKDVEIEFKCSAYIQRAARDNGTLTYKKIGREIQYIRGDVQTWVNSNTIR